MSRIICLILLSNGVNYYVDGLLVDYYNSGVSWIYGTMITYTNGLGLVTQHIRNSSRTTHAVQEFPIKVLHVYHVNIF